MCLYNFVCLAVLWTKCYCHYVDEIKFSKEVKHHPFFYKQILVLIMPPTLKKLVGHIAFGSCVRAPMCPYVHPSRFFVHARVLKFHV